MSLQEKYARLIASAKEKKAQAALRSLNRIMFYILMDR